MRPEFEQRWREEISNRAGRLKKPLDLVRRKVSAEDFIDTAVIGGVEVSDIIAGKIAESQIPQQVIEAFHEQYPNYGSSFVDAVEHLHHDPERLMGLVNAVKGKLFELNYLDWLNHHLPAGISATLAEHANNTVWDIAIHDAHGHAIEHLQLKASEYLGHAYEALAAHPDIDVVIPEDVYAHLTGHEGIIDHLVNGHVDMAHLDGAMNHAVDAAHNAGVAEHFPIAGPVIVIALAAGMNWSRYRNKKISLKEYVQQIGERGALAVIAGGAGWALNLLSGEPLLALPMSMTVRLAGGQVLHNYHQRERLDGMVRVANESRWALSRKFLPYLAVPKTKAEIQAMLSAMTAEEKKEFIAEATKKCSSRWTVRDALHITS